MFLYLSKPCSPKTNLLLSQLNHTEWPISILLTDIYPDSHLHIWPQQPSIILHYAVLSFPTQDVFEKINKTTFLERTYLDTLATYNVKTVIH